MSKVRRALAVTAVAAFLMLLPLKAAAQSGSECEICHYWSEAACEDACTRAHPGLDSAWSSCMLCCSWACGDTHGDGGGDNQCTEYGCADPILVDFGAKGLDLTDVAGGVSFDIDGDGAPESISWTSATAEDAFLALDINGNGVIDGAKELFGDASDQPRSTRPNGFRALAEYDRGAFGGNGDGVLSAADLIWPRLLFWVDRSHDGISQADELTSVSASPVTGFVLEFRVSRRRDRFGNQYTYRSTALAGDEAPRIDVFDVFFNKAP